MVVREAVAHAAAAPMVEHMVVDRERVIHFGAGGPFGSFYGRYTTTIMQAAIAGLTNQGACSKADFISNGYCVSMAD